MNSISEKIVLDRRTYYGDGRLVCCQANPHPLLCYGCVLNTTSVLVCSQSKLCNV
jgi:hypothetical protein